MRLIDADEIKLPQGFFEKVDNVPKFYEWLDEQPTVDAEPVKHGYWEWDGYVYDMLWRCSECSCLNENDSDYCPNCGAKMDELTMVQAKSSDKEFTLYADEKPIVTFKDDKIVLHGERKEDG